MYRLKEIADKVYYVGVNDRQKHLFENMWPLPYGVSYNSYLIADEKTVLVDTVDVCYADAFLKKISDALAGRPLDYLIVNHMEPDHAGSIRLLRQAYPDVQIVGNKRTFEMLNGFHGITTGLHEVFPRHHDRLARSEGRRYARHRQTYAELLYGADGSLAGSDGNV